MSPQKPTAATNNPNVVKRGPGRPKSQSGSFTAVRPTPPANDHTQPTPEQIRQNNKAAFLAGLAEIEAQERAEAEAAERRAAELAAEQERAAAARVAAASVPAPALPAQYVPVQQLPALLQALGYDPKRRNNRTGAMAREVAEDDRTAPHRIEADILALLDLHGVIRVADIKANVEHKNGGQINDTNIRRYMDKLVAKKEVFACMEQLPQDENRGRGVRFFWVRKPEHAVDVWKGRTPRGVDGKPGRA